MVLLGDTGRNFAAGMSGGVAYVYDPKNEFEKRCNQTMVNLERVHAANDQLTLPAGTARAAAASASPMKSS